MNYIKDYVTINLPNKLWDQNKTDDINVKVFNIVKELNKPKTLKNTFYIIVNVNLTIKCNSKQMRNN